MPEEIKVAVLRIRSEVFLNVNKDYITSYSSPSKINFFDPSRGDTRSFTEVKYISEDLKGVDIDKEDYKKSIRISNDNSFQFHLRRPVNSLFVDNYFDIGLISWEASIDIQPVFDCYKAVTYMSIYLSKPEDECSQAIKQTFIAAMDNGADS